MQAQRTILGRFPWQDSSFTNTDPIAPKRSTGGVSASNSFILMRHDFFTLGLCVSARHLIKQLMETEKEGLRLLR